MVDAGFIKGQSDNLPRLDMFMTVLYIKNSEDFSQAEVRGLKARNVVSLDPNCEKNIDVMHCKNFKSSIKNIATELEKSEISLLNIRESNISKITEDDFKHFNNMFELHITESHLDVIENNTFKNNNNLLTLNFSDNYLKNFDSNAVFTDTSKLNILDLSKNMLLNLSYFNITQFPKLKFLIVNENGLEYLPKNLIDKLKEKNEFYISIAKNPWNCSHEYWKDFLDPNLITAFCGEKYVYIPKTKPAPRDKRTNQSKPEFDTEKKYLEKNALAIFEQNDAKSNKTTLRPNPLNFTLKIETLEKNETGRITYNCFGNSFYYCIFWFMGGIWIGIILGHAYKIKRLLFSRSKPTYAEVGVQCDHHHGVIQLRMSELQHKAKSSGPHASKNLKKQSSKTAPPTDKDKEKSDTSIQLVSILK